MSIGATEFGFLGAADAAGRVPRELSAIVQATEWLNTPRLTSEGLLGKVVVVNFCTYTCINWLRTLPYVRAWSQKYGQKLVVVGVHTPEFVFERNLGNVRRAVQQMKIEYPIVIDNDYSIWRAFKNLYWPALYFLDPQGRIRHHHHGEGEYDTSERAIQRLLTQAGVPGIGNDIAAVDGSGIEAAADWTNLRSPETYLGYQRTTSFVSRVAAVLDQGRAYAPPATMGLNEWSLAGEWTMGKQSAALNKPGGQIVYRFHARDVHLVMGPARPGQTIRFRVTIDGQAPGTGHGVDVDESGSGTVTEQRLYQLARQPRPIVDRSFAIEFLDAGVEAYAFTFG